MHWKKPGTLIVLACAVVVLALMLPGVATAKKSTADTVLTNGFVYTVENHGNSHNVETAQAVAIRDGKIIFVGTERGGEEVHRPAHQGRRCPRQDGDARPRGRALSWSGVCRL